MESDNIADIYREYIACLNNRDWDRLTAFVADDVTRNGKLLRLSGYRDMLERDVSEIPDLRFHILLMVCEPPFVASRLGFDCTPKGSFLGLTVNGRRVSFTENVIYEFQNAKIQHVWSVVDKAAIEAQIKV
ncbi:ester cyclase [Hyphomicrobium sp. MC8b]|uniref:ester cyclase n=1 Tax=Hyphomicrobium sp. MC8b TaxID=300273 RepID=UPI00391B7E0A